MCLRPNAVQDIYTTWCSWWLTACCFVVLVFRYTRFKMLLYWRISSLYFCVSSCCLVRACGPKPTKRLNYWQGFNWWPVIWGLTSLSVKVGVVFPCTMLTVYPIGFHNSWVFQTFPELCLRCIRLRHIVYLWILLLIYEYCYRHHYMSAIKT